MSPSIWQILVVALLALLFFGRGRISELMGDLGKGITSFKRGLRDEEEAQSQRRLPADTTIDQPPPAAPTAADARPAEPAPDADRH